MKQRAAIDEWRADKSGRTIQGPEVAVFGFNGARITKDSFFASDLGSDQASWGG